MIWLRLFLQSFLAPKRCLFEVLAVCVALLGVQPCYALDRYDDDCASTTGWAADNVNGTFTAVTWEGASSFKCYVATAASGNYGGADRIIPVTGDTVRIDITMDNDVIGTFAEGNAFSVGYYAGSYRTSVRFGTDGITIGNAGELGTDIVDSGVKTDWTIILKNPNTATGSATVYKNKVYIGVLSNVTVASTFPAGFLVLRQSATTLNNATTYVDSLSVSSYGLQYFATASVINTWTDADGGNGVSSLISGKMNFTVASAGSGNFARRSTVITYTTKVVVEARLKHNLIGTRASNDYWRFAMTPSATQICDLRFASDGLYVRTGPSTFVEVGTDIVSTGQYDTWRIWHDFSANKSWIWKNGVFVAGDVTDGYATTGLTAGLFYMAQMGYTVKGNTDVDYLRIYSEDGQLIQTVIE